MDRRPEIFEIAMELFAEHGYDNTPMSLVSRKLGMSKAGIYHYFPSKEHLIFMTHKYFIEKNLLPIVEEAEKISDPLERISYYINHNVKSLISDDSARLLIRESHRLSPEHLDEVKEVWRRLFYMIRDSIRELEEQKRTIDLDANMATFAIIGMVSWIIFWFDSSRGDSADLAAESYAKLIFNGLLKRNQ